MSAAGTPAGKTALLVLDASSQALPGWRVVTASSRCAGTFLVDQACRPVSARKA